LIVEPIQSEGGDNHASPAFFQGLRDITKKHGVMMIVDEVQTGFGATGKFWGHEHWKLTSPPDLVTFSKKAQTAGYFFGDRALIPDKAYRQFNTWIGDAARVIMSKAIIEEILAKDLVAQTVSILVEPAFLSPDNTDKLLRPVLVMLCGPRWRSLLRSTLSRSRTFVVRVKGKSSSCIERRKVVCTNMNAVPTLPLTPPTPQVWSSQ
jgi:hypothetical protein